ncbi:MAG TPA: sugar phosphate nucleotidyltransferase [Vicinamibacterales bacterium]|nr:sugar phosphate nucleotidyltransferase [Vicinamibacterales bacterium]
MIPALVLTAGLATRLRPLSLVRAKAALPVAGEPLVRRILRQLAAAGVTDAVLNLHHLPATITGLLGDGRDLGVHVRYSWENPVLGSAGGPRKALPLLRETSSGTHSTFLLVNGDTLTDVDLHALVAAHRNSGTLVTMAVVPNTEPLKYGGALVEDDGIITGFVRRGSPQPSWHVVGVQVAEAAAFASVPDNVPYESVLTLYPALIGEKRGSLRAFRCKAEFFDIGTPADYLDTSLLLAARDHAATAGTRTHVDPSARVERSILWDDVDVEAGAMLRECVVTDGVRVPADTSWHGVSLRVARGDLAPGERDIEGLAVASL